MLSHRPDMASLATGSVNFPNGIYENPPDFVDGLASEMLKYDIKPEIEIFDFIPLRTCLIKRLVRKLDETTATGSDKIAAGILKRKSDVLAFPFIRICRRLLYEE